MPPAKRSKKMDKGDKGEKPKEPEVVDTPQKSDKPGKKKTRRQMAATLDSPPKAPASVLSEAEESFTMTQGESPPLQGATSTPKKSPKPKSPKPGRKPKPKSRPTSPAASPKQPAKVKEEEWSISKQDEMVDWYRGLTWLYDKNDPDYKNKAKRVAALKEMAEHFDTTEGRIQTWVSTNRTRYVKLASRKSGDASYIIRGEVNKWCFKRWAFLHPHVQTLKPASQLGASLKEQLQVSLEGEEGSVITEADFDDQEGAGGSASTTGEVLPSIKKDVSRGKSSGGKKKTSQLGLLTDTLQKISARQEERSGQIRALVEDKPPPDAPDSPTSQEKVASVDMLKTTVMNCHPELWPQMRMEMFNMVNKFSDQSRNLRRGLPAEPQLQMQQQPPIRTAFTGVLGQSTVTLQDVQQPARFAPQQVQPLLLPGPQQQQQQVPPATRPHSTPAFSAFSPSGLWDTSEPQHGQNIASTVDESSLDKWVSNIGTPK